MRNFFLTLLFIGSLQQAYSQMGCIDPTACNYNNPTLSACRYIGQSCNNYIEFNNSYYDTDCQCILQYLGDYNGDGFITVHDVGGFLEEWSSADVHEFTTGDMSGDGFVNVSDLAIFGIFFGQQLY